MTEPVSGAQWAAHIRKAYPRDEVRNETSEPDETGSAMPKRRRRPTGCCDAGSSSGPELATAETATRRTTQDRGLLFVLRDRYRPAI